MGTEQQPVVGWQGTKERQVAVEGETSTRDKIQIGTTGCSVDTESSG